MEHLSFEIICRIADGDIKQNEMAKIFDSFGIPARSCQQEVELQRSICKSFATINTYQPFRIILHKTFSMNIIPSQKKKWYEWILHNMGNIIAMASVLAF